MGGAAGEGGSWGPEGGSAGRLPGETVWPQSRKLRGGVIIIYFILKYGFMCQPQSPNLSVLSPFPLVPISLFSTSATLFLFHK